MTKTAMILKSTGEVLPLTTLSLVSLQASVGGWIEQVPTNDGSTMYVNEDGKRLGLPINLNATARYLYAFADAIRGDVVVIERASMRRRTRG